LTRRFDTSADFEWHGLRVEIVDVDGKRIDQVLVMSKEELDEKDSPLNTQPLPEQSANDRSRSG